MKLGDRVKEFVERNPDEQVLNTGYTLATLREDLERREEAVSSVESWAKKMRGRKQDALEKALDADYGDKVGYYREAEKNRIMLELFEDLRDKLLVEQLFLSKLVNQAVRQNYLDDTAEGFDFEVDIAELDAESVASAVDGGDIMQEESLDVVEQVDSALDRSGGVDMPVDLSDVRREAEELEADQIEVEMEAEDSGVAGELDRRIEAELERMDEEFDEQ